VSTLIAEAAGLTSPRPADDAGSRAGQRRRRRTGLRASRSRPRIRAAERTYMALAHYQHATGCTSSAPTNAARRIPCSNSAGCMTCRQARGLAEARAPGGRPVRRRWRSPRRSDRPRLPRVGVRVSNGTSSLSTCAIGWCWSTGTGQRARRGGRVGQHRSRAIIGFLAL
jgi:hypothetical protein